MNPWQYKDYLDEVKYVLAHGGSFYFDTNVYAYILKNRKKEMDIPHEFAERMIATNVLRSTKITARKWFYNE